jgi:hypothetical protein
MFSKIKEIFFGKPVVAEAPYKVETPPVVAVGEPPATVVIVEGAGKVEAVPAWHTAPAEGSKLAENSLDVNHDGKVNLADIKELVSKPAKAKKPAAKKAAPVKKAAKAKTPRSKKA